MIYQTIDIDFFFKEIQLYIKFNKFNNSRSYIYHIGHVRKEKRGIVLFIWKLPFSKHFIFYCFCLWSATILFFTFFRRHVILRIEFSRYERQSFKFISRDAPWARNGNWFEGTLQSRSAILIKKLSTNSKRCSDGINENSSLR